MKSETHSLLQTVLAVFLGALANFACKILHRIFQLTIALHEHSSQPVNNHHAYTSHVHDCKLSTCITLMRMPFSVIVFLKDIIVHLFKE